MRLKDDAGKLAVDMIRHLVWQDVNRLPEQIQADLQARGLKATVNTVQSTRNNFLGHLTWLANKKIYIAPILKHKIPVNELRSQTMAAAKAVRMADNVAQQVAA